MRENMRAWTESLETFVLEGDLRAAPGQAGRLHARRPVCALEAVRPRREGPPRPVRLPHPARDATLGVQVIAIGNITVGGTGKTPVVEKFARELKDQGRNVAILSRGYRSKPAPLHRRLLNKMLLREDTTPPRVVSDGKSLLLDSESAGDEPYMLASNLRDVVVLVDKDRVKAGLYAIEKFGCDTLLLDDGYQYWKLAGRRRDIVLIDCRAAVRKQPSPAAGHPARAPQPPVPSEQHLHHQGDGPDRGPAAAHPEVQPEGGHHRVCPSAAVLRGRVYRDPARHRGVSAGRKWLH